MIDSKKIRIITLVKNLHSVCFFAVFPSFALPSSCVLKNACFYSKQLHPLLSLVED